LQAARDTDWNGSGMHANFSTKYMREAGGKEYFEQLMKAFESAREDHIAVYGPDNHLRLTGKHETAAITEFTYGVADRGASIRVPHSFVNNGYKGLLEDRARTRRATLPDRFPDPEDDRVRADRRQGGRGLKRPIEPPASTQNAMIRQKRLRVLADQVACRSLTDPGRGFERFSGRGRLGGGRHGRDRLQDLGSDLVGSPCEFGRRSSR